MVITVAGVESHTIIGSLILNNTVSNTFYTKIVSDLIAIIYRLV